MLLHFRGLRKSEVFHLFVSDITLDPYNNDEALVRVYHPEYGKSPLLTSTDGFFEVIFNPLEKAK